MDIIEKADPYFDRLMREEWHPMYMSVGRVKCQISGFTPSLIQSGQYMTMAQRFASDPIKARMPESVIDRWLEKVCDTVAFIYLSTKALRSGNENADKKYLSDFAPEMLFRILLELRPNSTVEEKFMLIDRILNVTHPRGDLASLFITGGRSALDEISGKKKKNDGVREKGKIGTGKVQA